MQTNHSLEDWNAKQITYWNEIANTYDRLYSDAWSQREDMQTKQLLSHLVPKSQCRVLDLACGTGLGFRLCKPLNKELEYVGLDLSPSMIKRLSKRHPEVTGLIGSMDQLSCFSSNSFDVVMSLYTSFSFSNKPDRTLWEIFRILKPRGVLLISSLNHWSLRRLLGGKWGKFESYKTRNSDALRLSVPAWTYSRKQLRHLLLKSGFSNVTVYGQSFLAGVIEHDCLWQLNLLISRLLPDLCHTLNAVAVKA